MPHYYGLWPHCSLQLPCALTWRGSRIGAARTVDSGEWPVVSEVISILLAGGRRWAAVVEPQYCLSTRGPKPLYSRAASGWTETLLAVQTQEAEHNPRDCGRGCGGERNRPHSPPLSASPERSEGDGGGGTRGGRDKRLVIAAGGAPRKNIAVLREGRRYLTPCAPFPCRTRSGGSKTRRCVMIA